MIRDIIVIIYNALIIPQRYCIEPPKSKLIARLVPDMKVVSLLMKSAESSKVYAVSMFETIGGILIVTPGFPPSKVSGDISSPDSDLN